MYLWAVARNSLSLLASARSAAAAMEGFGLIRGETFQEWSLINTGTCAASRASAK